ncbi:hypothetical protein BKA69DRAFT_1095925 [Paraphysoderma sedebokerense]|nr:hypothetical protein BKA69DRAFT_1095925 [Paraphysoderma sedebokerense]
MKLFVGGLSWDTDEDTLRETFGRFGEIEDCIIIKDRESGRSRGFGFVTFASESDADAALSELNNTELDSRTIRVDRADNKPQGERGGFRGSYRGGRGGFGRGGGGGGFGRGRGGYGGGRGRGGYGGGYNGDRGDRGDRGSSRSYGNESSPY